MAENEDVPVIGEDDGIRPKLLADFGGQFEAVRSLRIALVSARSRKSSMPHTLLFGSPGLGKTTLAHIVANEMGSKLFSITAPAIKKAAELASVLVSMSAGDILFIDEIHRLQADIAELLYPPMEDGRLNIVQQDAPFGPSQSVSLELEPFTLIGATTKAGELERPFRQRFDLAVKLELYSVADLTNVVRRSAGLLGVNLSEDGAADIARRSRGTPRIANSFLRRIRDFVIAEARDDADADLVRDAFDWLKVSERGLGDIEHRYLQTLRERFAGGPVGIETLAAAMGEDSGYLADEVEPWLVKEGYVDRTQRGRKLSNAARQLDDGGQP